MNVPHENSPVVDAPTTRAGGGSSALMSPRCAASSLPRKSLTSMRRSEDFTILADVGGSEFCELALVATTLANRHAISSSAQNFELSFMNITIELLIVTLAPCQNEVGERYQRIAK